MPLLDSCFDNLTINDTIVLNEDSLVNLHSLTLAYVVWILASFLNIPAAVLTFLATRKSKSMSKTMTNKFLQQANFCISLASLSFSVMGIHHIRNIYGTVPETQCRYECFLKIGYQALLFSLTNTFIFAIAVDRFYATLLPLNYKQVVEVTGSWKVVRRVSISIWTVEFVFYGSQFLETTNPVLKTRIFTTVTGQYSFYILSCKLLLLGLWSVLLYLTALIYIAKKQRSQVGPYTGFKSAMDVLKKQQNRQLFKALVLHAVVQGCTLLVCYSKLLYGAIVWSDRGSASGPYFTILNTSSSLSNFIIYMICLRRFRRNCKYLLTSMKNSIVSSVA